MWSNNFWLSLADKIMTGIYNFVSLIVKKILLVLSLSLTLSLLAAAKHNILSI